MYPVGEVEVLAVIPKRSTGPLAGLRIVELGGIGPAPYCGMLLADQGADVIRLDPPQLTGRRTPFPVLHRNKRSVTVDMKTAAGVDLVRRMAVDADAVIEGFRPGVAERLGVGPTALCAANSALVYGRMTGWGQDGPFAQVPGHDVNYLALSGVLHNTGTAGGPPIIPLNLVGDMGGGGMMLAYGLTAALLSARATGVGQVVDAAMVDGAVSQLAGIFGELSFGRWVDGRDTANFVAGNAPWYGVYRCADDGYVAVGCQEPQFYSALLAGLGLANEPLLADQMNHAAWPAMTARIAEVFAARCRDEWMTVFDGAETCISPVLSIAEAAAHPHNMERGTFVRASDGMLQPAPVPRFLGTPAAEPAGAVRLGAHTREVLSELGLSETEVDELTEQHVIRCVAG
nr:CaiB/BaiF CoA-transferase family protein [Rhodococcus wratislaviensis]